MILPALTMPRHMSTDRSEENAMNSSNINENIPCHHLQPDDGIRPTTEQTHEVTDIRKINWNLVCREARKQRSHPNGNSSYWDSRAQGFAKNSSRSDYADKFLRMINVRPHWTILDVGSAAGTLAIPLAERVKSITALDISNNMLQLLRERCAKLGISTIHTVSGAWEDDWNALGIEKHDVAISSRSLITDDYESALTKLHHSARKRVYLSTIVGDGPHDRRIFEALGRILQPGPDYIYIYNLLYQMGIHANVNFINCLERNTYESLDEALTTIGLKLGDLTPTEEKVLQSHLEKYLVRHDGKWEMSYRRQVKWAVLWWDI